MFFLLYRIAGRRAIILDRPHATASDAQMDGHAIFPLAAQHGLERAGGVFEHDDTVDYPDIETATAGFFPVALFPPGPFPGMPEERADEPAEEAIREATPEEPTEHDERCFPGVQLGQYGNGECALTHTGITCPAESCDLFDRVRDEAGHIIP